MFKLLNYINSLKSNLFVEVVAIVIFLDTFLGVLRAIKQREFNSCFGIDGGIRKVAMLGCIAFLAALDMCVTFNLAFMLPQEWLSVLGVDKIGLCEFFCILFILYEAVSILKNMLLCGLPVPTKLKNWIEKFLNIMTDELPPTDTENLINESR